MSWEKVYEWYKMLKYYYDDECEDFDEDFESSFLNEAVFEGQGWHIEYATPAEL
jgi:hypothetical protein